MYVLEIKILRNFKVMGCPRIIKYFYMSSYYSEADLLEDFIQIYLNFWTFIEGWKMFFWKVNF